MSSNWTYLEESSGQWVVEQGMSKVLCGTNEHLAGLRRTALMVADAGVELGEVTLLCDILESCLRRDDRQFGTEMRAVLRFLKEIDTALNNEDHDQMNLNLQSKRKFGGVLTDEEMTEALHAAGLSQGITGYGHLAQAHRTARILELIILLRHNPKLSESPDVDEPEYPVWGADSKERLVCSAVWYPNYVGKRVVVHRPCNIDKGIVFAGVGHGFAMSQYHAVSGLPSRDDVQGFLTSTNRFVEREEAARIAYEAGQVPTLKDTIYSEDFLWSLTELKFLHARETINNLRQEDYE